MNNSSQNDSGVGQQPETENSSGYQQYLDPAKPKKQRKLIILAVIGAVMLLILLVIVVLAQTSNKQNAGQNLTARETLVCADEDCLESNFQECTPAEYTYNEADISSVKYKIQDIGEIGCSVEMSYLTSKYQTDVQGKSMVCDFDNTLDLDSAVQNVMDYPDDYDCQGELAEFFKNINNI